MMTANAGTLVQRKWTSGRRAKLKVDAIKDASVRNATMMVLENLDNETSISTGNFLMEESNTVGSFARPGSVGTGGNVTGPNAGTYGGNSSMYHPIAMALTRRVMPSLFAHKLVGVQPMNQPVGVAFAMRSHHLSTDGQTKLAEAAWNNVEKMAGFSGGYIAQGSAATYKAAVGTGPAPDVSIKVKPTLGAATTDATKAAYALADAGLFSAAMTTWIAAVNAAGFGVDGKGELVSWTGATDIDSSFARGINTADSELLGVQNVSGLPNTAATKINELGVTFDKKLIEAVERRLAASFSLQAMQDIKALHNIDLKMEVLEILQYETTSELDRELLNALKSTSIDTTNDGGSVLVVDMDAGGAHGDNRQATALVVNAILLAANTVAKYSKRGRANFVVVSPTVASVLQSAVPFFTANEAKVDPGIVLSGAESTEIGKLNGVLTVYLDQFAKTEYALVGYKGQQAAAYDSGVVFCPYTMNVVNEATAQENFQPRIGVMSRYAVANNLLSAGAYYRSIVFKGLDEVFGGSNWDLVTGW